VSIFVSVDVESLRASVPASPLPAQRSAGSGRLLKFLRACLVWRRRTPLLVGWACGLLFAAGLLVRNRFVFNTPLYEDGDYAADAMLIDRALHFRQLVGHYSRVGFNHPGPALLYVEAFAQKLFYQWTHIAHSPLGAHLIGIVLLNAVMVGITASILAHHTQRHWVGLLPVALMWAVEPHMMASNWMPHVFVCLFLVLLVSTAALLTLSTRYLWSWVLAACFLVHGHVSFVFIVGATGAMLLVVARIVQMRSVRAPGLRRAVIPAVAIAVVFAVPIVANLILHWPGEIVRYWHYIRRRPGGGNTLTASARAMRTYFTGEGYNGWLLTGGFVLAAVSVVLACAQPSSRRFLVSLLWAALALTAFTFVYAVRGVDHLEQLYITAFYVVVPLMLIAAVAIGAASRLPMRRWTRPALAGTAVLAALLAASRPGMVNPYRGATWIPDASYAIEASATDPARPIVLRFETQGWPLASGLLENERRRGRIICAEDEAYAVFFGKAQVCTAAQLASGRVIWIDPSRTEGSPLFSVPGVAIGEL